MNRYERMFREHRRVPVRLYGVEFIPLDHLYVALRVRFRHPCPCEGWKLDNKEFWVSQAFRSRDYTPKAMRKRFVDFIRAEACNHVAEFLRHGTIDGN